VERTRAQGSRAKIITSYLAKFAARLSGPYQVSVITAGQRIPYVRVVSQIDPELSEDVLCDFATDPPGYLTACGHRLGNTADPGAAAAALARLFHATSTQGP
jgi:hypothetical protein